MSTLWLIRHAKSSWAEPGLADFDRPLNARGQRDGPRMRDWLSRQPQPATWLWTSDAARALATASFVQAGFGITADRLVPVHALYLADADALLDQIQATPAEVQSVALVAHNPGLTDMVNRLAGHHETDNLPTFGVARFRVRTPWPELAFGQATLEQIVTPKTLPDAAERTF